MLRVNYYPQLRIGMCGAAALQMVYDFYGDKVDQQAIWKSIRSDRPGRPGEKFAYSFSLAFHAIHLGYPTILAIGSLDTLQHVVHKEKIPPIVSQQITTRNPLGHFRVVIGINHKVRFHDPQFPKYKSLSTRRFEKLWRPKGNEVAGYVLIAISRRDQHLFSETTCLDCGKYYFRWDEAQGVKHFLCPECDRRRYLGTH